MKFFGGNSVWNGCVGSGWIGFFSDFYRVFFLLGFGCGRYCRPALGERRGGAVVEWNRSITPVNYFDRVVYWVFLRLPVRFFSRVATNDYQIPKRTLKLRFTGFYRVLLGFTEFYRVLLCFTGFYRVLLGFIGIYWVLLGFTGFYWVL